MRAREQDRYRKERREMRGAKRECKKSEAKPICGLSA